MTFFLCKMILPRSDFVQTMTDSEQNIMKAHGDYLQSLTEVGSKATLRERPLLAAQSGRSYANSSPD